MIGIDRMQKGPLDIIFTLISQDLSNKLFDFWGPSMGGIYQGPNMKDVLENLSDNGLPGQYSEESRILVLAGECCRQPQITTRISRAAQIGGPNQEDFGLYLSLDSILSSPIELVLWSPCSDEEDNIRGRYEKPNGKMLYIPDIKEELRVPSLTGKFDIGARLYARLYAQEGLFENVEAIGQAIVVDEQKDEVMRVLREYRPKE